MKNNVVLNIIIAAVILEVISALQFCSTQRLLTDELEIRAESELTMKTIVITDTRCSACGAPLEDEVCRYCGTRAVIYKTIT